MASLHLQHRPTTHPATTHTRARQHDSLLHRRSLQHHRHSFKQQHSSASIIARAEAADQQSSYGIVYSQQQADVTDTIKFPCTVPLLPFTVEEVLLPGSVKTLHLFEARYLAMLDSVLAQPGANKVFAHVVVEQQGDAFGDTAASFPGAFKGDGFVFLMATLVRVVEVKKSFVGALVRVQAEARAEVKEVVQLMPYFVGEVVPLCDQPLQDEQLVSTQVEQLSQTIRDLQNLTQRFKSKQSASLQQAVYWADRAVLVPAAAAHAAADSSPDSSRRGDWDSSSSTSSSASGGITPDAAGQPHDGEAASEARSSSSEQQPEPQDLAEKAARLSFAALQGVPQESAKDQLKLLRCCVRAMKTTETSTRLTVVQEHMQNSLNLLAAKCALKALNLG